jgi:DNA-binding IclR family transcriptional regulator
MKSTEQEAAWWSGVQHHMRRNAAKSALRALEVLEYFGSQNRPLRAFEIAQAFGLRPSSTDQMLKTLVDRAYLSFDAETKLYFPSIRLLGFASMMCREYGGGQLRRLVIELSTETDSIVTVNTLCGIDTQVVECLEGTHCNGLKFGLDTVPGAVLLGQYCDDSVRKIVDRAVLYGRCAKENAANLIRNSIAARQRGFAAGDNVKRGLRTLAAPLPRNPNHVPLALTLTAEITRGHREETALLNAMNQGIARLMH